VEGANSEVVAVKAASGDGRSDRSARRHSVDRGVAMGSTKRRTRRGSLQRRAHRGYRRARGGRCTWSRKTAARSESRGRCAVVRKTTAQVATVVRTRAGGCCEGEEGKLASPSQHEDKGAQRRWGTRNGGGWRPAAPN
jgi:hypothetical protein